jgi:hypothetical protein
MKMAKLAMIQIMGFVENEITFFNLDLHEDKIMELYM